jgi:hypothetical protein
MAYISYFFKEKRKKNDIFLTISLDYGKIDDILIPEAKNNKGDAHVSL